MVEVIQDITFVVVIVTHMIWTVETDWTESRITFVLNLIMGAGLIVGGISLTFAAFEIMAKVKEWSQSC